MDSPSPAAAAAPFSLVSRAKTALSSAAAKAEKVLTDIKADLKSDRDADGSSNHTSRKSVEQEPAGADDSSKPQQEKQDISMLRTFESSNIEVDLGNLNPTIMETSTKKISEREFRAVEESSSASYKMPIPPSSVLKQFAAAIESGKNSKSKSMTDLSTLVGDSLLKEKKGLSFSVVRSLVLREKEDISGTDICGDEEVQTMINSLFDSEENLSQRTTDSGSAIPPMTTLIKDIRGAPPECFIVRLSGIIGRLKSLQKMASFWQCVVVELRKLWSEGQPLPWMPLDANPDLNSCLLHQQLQLINCCIARKHRRNVAIKSLDSVLEKSSLNSVDSPGKLSPDHIIYARISSGEYVLRLGADHPSEDLTMLETDEPIYSPVTQEGPVLTEELIKETEEFVLRTGSVGAGCSQLLSDMQAFKAANPGCILEDFIRWHSPPDCTEMDSDVQPSYSAVGEGSSRRARLSRRMEKEGNLWRELWESAKALPAVKQTPLFDEDLAVESILTALEDIKPSELFEQLFASLLCSGLLIAEVSVPAVGKLSKLFYECKDYIIATYQSGMSNENVNEICKVYQTIETIVNYPDAIMVVDQPEEATSEQPRNLLKKISLTFANKDKLTLRRKASKDEKKPDEKNSHVFSQLFDKKSSLFSRRKSNSSTQLSSEPNSLDESDWTIV